MAGKLIVDHIVIPDHGAANRSTAGAAVRARLTCNGISSAARADPLSYGARRWRRRIRTDEPASELLKRIAAEKAELAKQGTKQKPPPRQKEEEKPFEPPRGGGQDCITNIRSLSQNHHKVKSSDIIG